MSTIKSSTTTSTAYSVTADTTGALVIQTGATPTTALTISSAQVVTLTNALAEASGGTGTTIGYNGFKNRIINGAMVIDQRNAGASVATTVTGTPTYTLDRFAYQASQASKYTVQQNAAAVTPPTGFLNYLGVTSTSSYVVLTADYFLLRQPIEGFNTSDLGFGTASASTVTLSFWVRSSLTGTFGGSLGNGSRSYPFTYTISVANTWEQKSITIAGDTSGTWVGATNATGMILAFSLGMGSTYSTTAGAWAAGNYLSATSATSVVGTNGATFYITGVQLEKGSTATSFDYRPYGTELQLCQRYYEKSYNQSVVAGTNAANGSSAGFATSTTNGYNYGHVSFAVAKRAAPTITTYSYAGTVGRAGDGNGTDMAASSAGTNTIGESGFQINNASGGTLTFTGNSYFVYWTASIEL